MVVGGGGGGGGGAPPSGKQELYEDTWLLISRLEKLQKVRLGNGSNPLCMIVPQQLVIGGSASSGWMALKLWPISWAAMLSETDLGASG